VANAQANAQANAKHVLKHNSSDTDTDTDTEEIENQNQNTDEIEDQNQTTFSLEQLYERYPRKVGRRAALNAIRKAMGRLMDGEAGTKLNPEQAFQFLLAQVSTYAEARHDQDPTFTPRPATWFNRSSYLDDSSEWQQHEQQQRVADRIHKTSASVERQQRTNERIARVFGLDHTGNPGADGGSTPRGCRTREKRRN